MRTVLCTEIIQNVKEMCIEANHFLSSDMKKALETAKKKEHSPLGTQILGQLEENLQIAAEDKIPICQDTGMAVLFVKCSCRNGIRANGKSQKIYKKDENFINSL